MQRTGISRVAISVATMAMLAGIGCASTPDEPPPPPPAPEGAFVEERVVEEVVEVEVPELRTVYFDFDKASVRSDARDILKENARIIMSNRQLGTITLQGNADERGTEEYNLALGDRRAQSVKRYLVDLGVPSSRLVTVSFGEAKPAVMGHDESAWRWNRRAEFRVVR